MTQTRYTKAYLQANNAEFSVETSGTKLQMHDWQHQRILDYIDANGEPPPLNFNTYWGKCQYVPNTWLRVC